MVEVIKKTNVVEISFMLFTHTQHHYLRGRNGTPLWIVVVLQINLLAGIFAL